MARKKYFTEDFMKKFSDVHKQALGEDIGTKNGGSPDMGSGYYSK